MVEIGRKWSSDGDPELGIDLDGKRVLIVKQSSLGDIIHTLPVVHALKRCHPSCRIGWIAEEGFAALVRRDPAVARVHAIHIPSTSSPGSGRSAYFRAMIATLRTLRQLRTDCAQVPYDLILDLHASFRSGLLALANPGGVRIGFAGARELNPLFQHHLITIPEGMAHAVEKNLLFCRLLGCEPTPADFHLCASAEDEEGVHRFFAAEGLDTSRQLVYVNPTARWQSKFWLAERWAELADRLLADGITPVFGGAPGEEHAIRQITDRMDHRAVVAAGRLSLTESVALMRRASAYVGLDTGPMHMAAMAGIPVVALFGPTHPERVGPYGSGHIVVQAAGLSCLCCRKRTCEQASCMRGISVDMVHAGIMAQIGTSTAGES